MSPTTKGPKVPLLAAAAITLVTWALLVVALCGGLYVSFRRKDWL